MLGVLRDVVIAAARSIEVDWQLHRGAAGGAAPSLSEGWLRCGRCPDGVQKCPDDRCRSRLARIPCGAAEANRLVQRRFRSGPKPVFQVASQTARRASLRVFRR